MKLYGYSLVLPLSLLALSGCSMFSAWKSIPPPGGCDQCHFVQIKSSWRIQYQAAQITDERGQFVFQTPQFNTPIRRNQPRSPVDAGKTVEHRCFDCHNAPDSAHKERKGSFYH